MANWLMTVDHEEFDLKSAYDVLSQIYWENDVQTRYSGLQLQDIVYVYVIGEVAKVMYQMRVIGHAENSEYPKSQKAFWIKREKLERYTGKFAILQKLKKIDKQALSRKQLLDKKLIIKNTIAGSLSDNPQRKSKSTLEAYAKLFTYLEDQFKDSADYPDEADIGSSNFPEGGKKTVQVNRYERNPEARAKCIEIYGTRCYVCTMSFEHTYGQFAKDFIHVHHIKFLSDIKEEYEVDPEKDLRPVCPNCHAMLHRQENGIPMTVDRLKLLYEVSRN